MERFEATPLRVINEVGHAWGVRMGTRLQYDLCSHVYSHYPSTAKGSLLPPLWLKYHCRSPEKTIANAEAVHLLLSLWLRTDHSCINKEHIHIGENLRFTERESKVSHWKLNLLSLRHAQNVTVISISPQVLANRLERKPQSITTLEVFEDSSLRYAPC
jgi:hypothetical protein